MFPDCRLCEVAVDHIFVFFSEFRIFHRATFVALPNVNSIATTLTRGGNSQLMTP